MPRRPAPSRPKEADLAPEKKRNGLPRLERRIAELKAFDPLTVNDRKDPRIGALGRAIDETLVAIFGADTVDYDRYRVGTRLDTAGHYVGYEPPRSDIQMGLVRGKDRALSILEGIVKRFHEELELEPAEARSRRPEVAGTDSRRIFIVHGHDEGPREAVARFLERLGFEPVILHERPNQGRTVIEKVEAHGDVGFAVVLLTPDDVGGSRPEQLQRRPRQNVLLELGYFIGRLGRERVCALKRGEMELPTDFAGVVWEDFDNADGWKRKLGRELEATGFEIDWNKVMR